MRFSCYKEVKNEPRSKNCLIFFHGHPLVCPTYAFLQFLCVRHRLVFFKFQDRTDILWHVSDTSPTFPTKLEKTDALDIEDENSNLDPTKSRDGQYLCHHHHWRLENWWTLPWCWSKSHQLLKDSTAQKACRVMATSGWHVLDIEDEKFNQDLSKSRDSQYLYHQGLRN